MYIPTSECPTDAYVSLVDKILTQQQHDTKLAEEARTSRYIESEATDSETTLVPQPVVPQPVRVDHPDSITSQLRSALGCWEPVPGSSPPPTIPPPVTTPSVPEKPRESLTPRPPISPSPSTPEPANNAYPVSNALQNLRRKLVSHMPSSPELVRSSPSPEASLWVIVDFVISCQPFSYIASGTGFPLILSSQEHVTCDASK